MRLKTKGKTCYICGGEIKPQTKTKAGDECHRIKPAKGAAFYIHETCWQKLPKVGGRR